MRIVIAGLVILALLLISGVRFTTVNAETQETRDYDAMVDTNVQLQEQLERWEAKYAEAMKREDDLIHRLEVAGVDTGEPAYVPGPVVVPGGGSISVGDDGDDDDDGGGTIIRRQRSTTVTPEESNDPSPSSPPSSEPVIKAPKIPELPDVKDITKNTPLKDVL